MHQKAIKDYGRILGQEQLQIPEFQNYIPLISWAAWKGHEDVVRQLLDTGKADVNSNDTYGKTPLS
jgi:hypothetical protein